MSSEVPKCEHGANQICAPCNREFKRLKDIAIERDAALSREAELQRQLCRLRESVLFTKSFDMDTPGYGPCWCDTFYEAQEKGHIDECKILNAALSSSAPCPSCSRLAAKLKDRETIGRLMHESWTKTKREQGYHHTSEPCTNPYIKCCELSSPGNCNLVHNDLVPWEQLPEKQKDINRHAFDAVLRWMEE